MKTVETRGNSKAVSIIFLLMIAPAFLFALGYILTFLLACDGPHELVCIIPGVGGPIVAMLWSPLLLYITVPVGLVLIFLLTVFSTASRPRIREIPDEPAAPAPLAALTRFKPGRLDASWFERLDLSGLERTAHDPTAPDWPCAIDTLNRVLFTRLQHGPAANADAAPEYLLAIGEEVFIVVMDGALPRITAAPGRQTYTRSWVTELAHLGLAALRNPQPVSSP
ncbi:hypothetical protein [Massilia sp. CF038]|uniref:hypothetical protein n=1 Tax=Massilia sp. CF038 TaxID=1881045 RepID=UPI0009198906|nr:hypothetical protein [Massilia sp. CF038]SHG55359.1 hypothetical protein SAMN05428948_0999 [Massilia sp. CF038]